MEMRKLGHHARSSPRSDLPGVAISDLYGHDRNDEEGVVTLHAAIDAGVTLLDTGDFYGSGYNELLIGTAVRQRKRDELTISVKFGSRKTWPPARGRGRRFNRTVTVSSRMERKEKGVLTCVFSSQALQASLVPLSFEN
jgi:aryl-alcohol dehydrogenase-like predicted oxidoreductase